MLVVATEGGNLVVFVKVFGPKFAKGSAVSGTTVHYQPSLK